jgi:Nuclease A inhibitor-like protein
MNRLRLLLALVLATPACSSADQPSPADDVASDEDPVSAATDTKVKNAIVKTTTGVSFLSESDHLLVWVRSAQVAPGPANAAFIHRAFSKVTDGDPMADKPLSKMKSETVAFEAFASGLVPVDGEDPDNFAYHTQMTKVLTAIRAHLQNPVVVRLGRPAATSGLVGAISVYIVGTLPSGKIGGLFTVSVET